MEFLLVVIVFSAFLHGESATPNSDLETSIDEYVNSLRECKGIPAMIVTVIKDDHVIHKKAYGYNDIRTKQDATISSRFCVASLTKAFTATLLAILLDEAGHDWDTPLARLMNGMVFPDQYRTQEITLRDMLSHKVGYPAYDLLWLSQSQTPDQMLRRLRYLEPIRTFRTGFTYSNLMYILAGRVAERLGGKSWELLIRERILEPLDMHETGFAWEASIKPEIYAKPHLINKNTEENVELPIEAISEIDASFSAASLCTTANDMAKWMMFLLNRKTSDAIKNTKLLDEMFRAQTSLPLEDWNKHTFRPQFPPGKYMDYGLGWFTGSYRGYEYFDHYGSMSSYFSLVSFLPQQKIAVFSSINGVVHGFPSLAPNMINYFILDRLLNASVWLDAEQVCEYALMERTPGISIGTWQFTSAVPLEPFIGTYGHPVFGNISVYYNKTTDQLNLMYGRYRFELEVDEDSQSEGRFTLKPVKWWWSIDCGRPNDFAQFGPYEEGGVAERVSIPCFENLPDLYFERDLKLSDIDSYYSATSPVLNIACALSSARTHTGQVMVVLLSVFSSYYFQMWWYNCRAVS